MLSTESSLKYFLVQCFASRILLLRIILFLYYDISYINLIFNLSLLLKMGAAPLHFWLPSVSEGLDWYNLFILLTWQKIAPFLTIFLNINNYLLTIFVILTSIIGAIGGLNQTSLRKIITYSSINHLGWIIYAIINNKILWFTYFRIYSFILFLNSMIFYLIKSFYLNQLIFSFKNFIIKFLIFTNFLSMGGLPPFLGFLPKWLILEIYSNYNPILIFLIVITTIISLNYYLRLIFYSLRINSIKINLIENFNIRFLLYFLIFNSIRGLRIIFLIYSFF